MAKTTIPGEYLDPSVISGQTEVTAVGSDHMLIFDATDNALKKALLSDLIETVGSTPTFSQISSTGDLTIDAAGDIILDADGDDWKFHEGGNSVFEIKHESHGVDFMLNTTDEDWRFKGSDGGSTITALHLDMSNAGRATFNSDVNIGGIDRFNLSGSTVELTIGTTGDTANDGGGISFVHNSSSLNSYLLGQKQSLSVATYSSTPILFLTNNTERMTINGSGLVHIGTSDTNHKGLSIRKSTDDSYTASSFNDESLLRLHAPNTEGNYAGITYTHAGGTEFFTGLVRVGATADITDYVFQGYNGNTNAYQEFMRIDSSGKLGIGTNSPSDKLDIMGGGYDQIRIGSNKTDNTNKSAGIVSTMYTNNSVSFLQGYFQNGDNSIYYGSADSAHRGIQNHYFYVNTNYNATSGHALAYQISSAGGHKHKFLTSANSNSTKVQIHNGEGLWVYNNGGSSYSSYGLGSALRVTELTTNQSATHYIEISGNLPGYSNGQYNCLKTDLNDLHFAAGNTYTGYISYNTGFTDISDIREKENITTITNATDKLKQLRGVYHTWKDTENRGTDTQMGMIAQEVESVVPEVVTTSNPTSLQTGEEDTDGLKGVSYGKLVPLLIETIKELEARIETLEG